ncbi:hypothetical protein HELRODRAFT_194386 [Helobdella robusta]|uniref:Uncharacterized protein n=1 Tax=Helobdella robusta TaxID=6412 RepID=T1FW02_HELRO|nr:hypothetical protein HELRODRAFT_194386 [Helobdella robusta]ESN92121.1 hypothetical protein HELRODRAFT_194386 [Helobdella robusta]
MKSDGSVVTIKPMATISYGTNQHTKPFQHQSRKQLQQQQQQQQQLQNRQQQQQLPQTQNRQQHQQTKEASSKKRTISEEGISGEGMSLHWLSVLEDAAQAARSCQSLYDGRHDNSAAFTRSSSTKSTFAKFFCLGKKNKKKKSASRERMRKNEKSRSRDHYVDSGNPTAAAILDHSIKSSTGRRDNYLYATDVLPRKQIYYSLEEEEARKQRLLMVHKLNSLSQSGRGSLSGWGDSGVIDQSSDLGTSFGDDGILTSSTVGSARTRQDYHAYHRSMSTLSPQQQQQLQQRHKQQFMHEQIEIRGESNEKDIMRSQSEHTIPRTPNKIRQMKGQEMKDHQLSERLPAHQFITRADVEPVPPAKKKLKEKPISEKFSTNKMNINQTPNRIESRFSYHEEGKKLKRRNGESSSPATSEEARQGSATTTTSSKTSLTSSNSEKTDSDRIFVSNDGSQINIKEGKCEPLSVDEDNIWRNKNRISQAQNKISIENYQIEPKSRTPSGKQKEKFDAKELIKSRDSNNFSKNTKNPGENDEIIKQEAPEKYQVDDPYMDTISNSEREEEESNTFKSENETTQKRKLKEMQLNEMPFIDSCPSPKKNEIDTILEESFATSAGSAVSELKTDSSSSSSDDTISDGNDENKIKKKKKTKKEAKNYKASDEEEEKILTCKKFTIESNAKNEIKSNKAASGSKSAPSSPSLSHSFDVEINFSEEIENLRKLELDNLGKLEYHGPEITVEMPFNLLPGNKKINQKHENEIKKWRTPAVYKCRQTHGSDIIFENVTYSDGKPQSTNVKRCTLTIIWSFTKMEIKEDVESFVRVARLVLNYELDGEMRKDKGDTNVSRSVVHERKRGDGSTQWLEEIDGDVVESGIDEIVKTGARDENDKFADTSMVMQMVKTICDSLNEQFDEDNKSSSIKNKLPDQDNTTSQIDNVSKIPTSEKNKLKPTEDSDEIEREPFQYRKASLTHGKDDELFVPTDATRFSNIAVERPIDNKPEKVMIVQTLSDNTKKPDKFPPSKSEIFKAQDDTPLNKTRKENSSNSQTTEQPNEQQKEISKIDKRENKNITSNKHPPDQHDNLSAAAAAAAAADQTTSSDERYETADDEMMTDASSGKSPQPQPFHPHHPEINPPKQNYEIKCGGFGSRNIRDYISSEAKFDLDVVESSVACIGTNNFIIETSEKHYSNCVNCPEDAPMKRDSNIHATKPDTATSKIDENSSTIIISSNPLTADDKMWASDKEIDFNERPFATSSPKLEDFLDGYDNHKTENKMKNLPDENFTNLKLVRNPPSIFSESEDEKFMSPLDGSFVSDDSRKKENAELISSSAEFYSCDQYESDRQDGGTNIKNEKYLGENISESASRQQQPVNKVETDDDKHKEASTNMKESESFCDTDTETLAEESCTSEDEDVEVRKEIFIPQNPKINEETDVEKVEDDGWCKFNCGQEKLISTILSEAMAEFEKEFSNKIHNIPSIDWSTIEVPKLESVDVDSQLISLLNNDKTSDFTQVTSIPPPTYEEFMEEEVKNTATTATVTATTTVDVAAATTTTALTTTNTNDITIDNSHTNDEVQIKNTKSPSVETAKDILDSYFALTCAHSVQKDNDLIANYLENNKDELDFYKQTTSEVENDEMDLEEFEDSRKTDVELERVTGEEPSDREEINSQQHISEFICDHFKETLTDKELINQYLKVNENELDFYKKPAKTLDNYDESEQINTQSTVTNDDFVCGHQNKISSDKKLIKDYLNTNESELDFYKLKNENLSNNNKNVSQLQEVSENLHNLIVNEPADRKTSDHPHYADFICGYIGKTLTDEEMINSYLKDNENELDIYKDDEKSTSATTTTAATTTTKATITTATKKESEESDFQPSLASINTAINILEWNADFVCGSISGYNKIRLDEELISVYLENNPDELNFYSNQENFQSERAMERADKTTKFDLTPTGKNISDENFYFSCCHHDNTEKFKSDKHLIREYLENHSDELNLYISSGKQSDETIQKLHHQNKNDDTDSNFYLSTTTTTTATSTTTASATTFSTDNNTDRSKNVKDGTQDSREDFSSGAFGTAASVADWFSMKCGHDDHSKTTADEILIENFLKNNPDDIGMYRSYLPKSPNQEKRHQGYGIVVSPRTSDETEKINDYENDDGNVTEIINLSAVKTAVDILDWCTHEISEYKSNEILTDEQIISSFLKNNEKELEDYLILDEKNDQTDENKTYLSEVKKNAVSQPMPIPSKRDDFTEQEISDSSSSNDSDSNCSTVGSGDLEVDIDQYFAENGGDTMKRVSPSNRSSVSLSEFQRAGIDVRDGKLEEVKSESEKVETSENETAESTNEHEVIGSTEIKENNSNEIDSSISCDEKLKHVTNKSVSDEENKNNKLDGDIDGKASNNSEDKRKTNTSPIFGGFKKLFFDFFKIDKQEDQQKSSNNQENDKGKNTEKHQDKPSTPEKTVHHDPSVQPTEPKNLDIQNETTKPTSHNNETQEASDNQSSTEGNTSSDNDRTGSSSTSRSTFYEFHMNHKPRRPDDEDDEDGEDNLDGGRDIRIVKTTHQHSNNVLVQVFARNDTILKEVEKQYSTEHETAAKSSTELQNTQDIHQTGNAKECPSQTTGRPSRSSPNNSEQSGQSINNNERGEFLSPNQRGGGGNRSRSPSESPNRRNPSNERRKFRRSMMRGTGEVFPSRDTMQEHFDYIPNRVTVHVTPSMDDQITATLNTVENFYRMIEELDGDGVSWPKLDEAGRHDAKHEKRNSHYDKRRPEGADFNGVSTGFAARHSQIQNQLEQILKDTSFDGTPVDRDDKNQNRQRFEGKWVPVNDYTDSHGRVVKLPGMTNAEWMTLTDNKGQYATAGGGRIFARRRRSRGSQKQGSEDSSETASLNGSNAGVEDEFFDSTCPETDQLLLTSVRGSRMRFIYFLDKTEEATTAATQLVSDIIGDTEHDESIDGLDRSNDDTLEEGESDEEDGGGLTDQIMLIFASSDLAAGAFGGIGGDPEPGPWDDEAYRMRRAAAKTTTTTTTTSTTVTEAGLVTPDSSRSDVIIENNGDKYRASERWTTVNSFHGGSGSVEDLDSNLGASDGNYNRDSTTTEDDRRWFSDEEHPIHSPQSRDELRRRHRSIEDGISSFDERIHNLTDRIQRLKSVEMDFSSGQTFDRRSISGSSTDRREYTTPSNFYTASTTSNIQSESSYSSAASTVTRHSDGRCHTGIYETNESYKTAFEGSGDYGRRIGTSATTHGTSFASAGSGLYETTVDGRQVYGRDFSSTSSYKTATDRTSFVSASDSVHIRRGDDLESAFDPVVTAYEYAEMISIFKYCSQQFRRTFNESRNLRWIEGRPPVMVLPPRWVWGGPFAEHRARSTAGLYSSSIVHLSEQREYSPIAVAIVSDNFYVVATSNILYSQPGTIAVSVSRRRRSRRRNRTDATANQENESGRTNGDDSSFDNENGKDESSS